MAKSDREDRGRNPIVFFIYMVFVWPAYVLRWILSFIFKIVDWFFKAAEKLLKNDVKKMHERGGFSGFLAVLIDLVIAGFVWLIVLSTFSESQLLQNIAAFFSGSSSP
ncbi:MAG: hypothetical protein AAFX52_06420 [Pseudomonadota bacterium]